MSYRLAATLSGHEQDVRAVFALSDEYVVTASRDTTVRVWKQKSVGEFQSEYIFNGHDNYVNALAVLPPSQEFPNGLVVSGGSDKLILVHDPLMNDGPLYTLVGHTANVCALSTTPSGHIISGSWDKNAIVWKGFKQAHVLEGHQAAVWAVLAVNDSLILTGSADKTIRLWQNGMLVREMTGHTDAVRDLALLPSGEFVSCANDASLRIWTLDGQVTRELYGHTSFVYSVSALASGEIASSGEDGTMRIWKDGTCEQTIRMPCISVWTVNTLPNGDIIVGGSDSKSRIFTRIQGRMASEDAQKQFEELVASQAIPSNQMGEINKEDLQGPEALTQEGNKEGQVIMVKINDSIEAHQWSSASRSWQKIGDVVGGASSSKKQIYDGQEYDYVFDVDIGDGNGMLKLPFNAKQNPYDAAQQFIWKHQLPQTYLDQIANFITTNTQGVEIGQSGASHSDPFTGSDRYVPETSSYTASMAPGDPYTGKSSYRPNDNQYTPTSSTTRQLKILPQPAFLSLKQAGLDLVMAKANSFNEEESQPLSSHELTSLSEAVTALKAGKVDTNGLKVVIHACETWTPAHRYPMLDLLRIFIAASPSTVANAVPDSDLVHYLYNVGGFGATDAVIDSTTQMNALFACRGLVNMFEKGSSLLNNSYGTLLQVIRFSYQFKMKAARLAVITLSLNLSVFMTRTPGAFNDAQELGLLDALWELLKNEDDKENIYRLLVTFGTLMYHSSTCCAAAKGYDLKKLQSIAKERKDDSRIQSVVDEILSLQK